MADTVYTIATKLTSVCASVCSFYLSEAEADTYPYAVYDAVFTKSYTKSGAYKETGDATIHVVSNDFSEADTKHSALMTAIENGMNSDGFTTSFVEERKSCTDGIWTIDIRYTITKR